MASDGVLFDAIVITRQFLSEDSRENLRKGSYAIRYGGDCIKYRRRAFRLLGAGGIGYHAAYRF
jgi:hypothetical protein